MKRLRNDAGRILAEGRSLSTPTTVNDSYLRFIPAATFDQAIKDWLVEHNSGPLRTLLEEKIVSNEEERSTIRAFFSEQLLPIHRIPEEIEDVADLVEGSVRQVTVNAYERSPEARRECIASYGTVCHICEFDFAQAYGQAAEGYIHVHHLRPLSEIVNEHQVDPVKDLRPVCPNCHAVLHCRVPAYSIDEVRAFLRGRVLRAVPR